MEWREQGILLAVRKHGENAAIIDVLTDGHGRHAGVVRGGTSRKLTPILQPGGQLDLTWRARLADHLGSFTVEPVRARAGALMGDGLALAGLNAICALLCFSLPEREPHPRLYRATLALMDVLGADDNWPVAYLSWEVAFLEELGFGLDLGTCGATGATQDLAFVSPRTGRAVSRAGAAGFEDRLLPLPDVLRDPNTGDPAGVTGGLRTTGHFLKTGLAASLGQSDLPPARARLVDALVRRQAK
jgi:DNA repair protein RecO (recombination protein O)